MKMDHTTLKIPAFLRKAFPDSCQEAEEVLQATGYELLIPDHFLRQIKACGEKGLFRQVWPHSGELAESPYFTTDPLQEQAPATRKNGTVHLLQKYSGRALLLTTSQCFGNCRFCFRRHLRKEELFHPDENAFSQEIQQMATDSSLHEIILSGGDPMTLTDTVLESLLRRLAEIPHLRRIRFHTRVVSFCPERVSEKLLKILQKSPQTLSFVLHINHPAELSQESRQAIAKLHQNGILLLQQAVLLRGINDSVDVLATLYEKLADENVVPYYLHQLDRVAGATHFEVPVEEGGKLLTELRKRLPGYAVPRYVREIPGEMSKLPVPSPPYNPGEK
ncbi:MAG: KamA family radical SAM protein [Planctomycetia bacterium]|nr:KamA family radical SAM protein [Planctomycetia bacterium]